MRSRPTIDYKRVFALVHRNGLGSRPTVAGGRDSHARPSHGGIESSGHRSGRGATLQELSSGAELVGPGEQPGAAGFADYADVQKIPDPIPQRLTEVLCYTP